MKRRVISIILSLLMFTGVLTMTTGNFSANSSQEINIPNNNTWYQFNVSSNTTEYFSVTLPNAGRLKFSIFGATYDSRLYYKIYNDDYSNRVAYDSFWVDSNKPSNYLVDRVLSKGKYHIILEIENSGYIKLKSQFKNYSINTKDNSTYDNPNTLSNGKTAIGAFTWTNNDTAWYKINVTSRKIVQLNVYSYTWYIRCTLYNKYLSKEYTSIDVGGNETSPETGIIKLTLNKGTYYLKVDQGINDGLYKINYQSYSKPRLNYTNIAIRNKHSKQLKVIGGTGKIVWRSSNSKIATVSSTGKVTGKRKGSCVITARRNGYTMRCIVKVK